MKAGDWFQTMLAKASCCFSQNCGSRLAGSFGQHPGLAGKLDFEGVLFPLR